MRQEYNKLVRDRIPEIIRKSGLECETVTLSETEYRQALRQKLIEEAQEAATASDADLAIEIADLLEVVDALLKSYDISHHQVGLEQDKKRATKGDFDNQIMLLWTESNTTKQELLKVPRKNISTNTHWEATVGYSPPIRVGNFVHVSGTTATDKTGKIISANTYEQTLQIIRNIEAALQLAGAGLKDVVRTRIYVTNIDEWEQIGKAYREFFSETRPATTMVEVSGLVSPEILVEIEADAYIYDA
ncbi:MAG: Rid family hydrolase [Microcoleaceae cyanobacterium]